MKPILHYFAYGSNMNPARMRTRGLSVVQATGGHLPDYELRFNKMSRDHAGVGHANIEFVRGAATEGVLYELIDATEIHKMDPFERAPWNYGREVVPVRHHQGTTWAWTYFANPAVKQSGLTPPLEYLEHLLAGEDFLSPSYVQMLRRIHQSLL